MGRLRKYTTIFYSTHILDDVQRVSDTVAILNHGRLVAQAPIEELLAGSGGVIYQVGVKGATDETRARLSAQPWVVSITEKARDGGSTWHVSVTDEAVAEERLLRLILADDAVTVTEYGHQKYESEPWP
jgi:ABC-2 type transport system ATP-binding protein